LVLNNRSLGRIFDNNNNKKLKIHRKQFLKEMNKIFALFFLAGFIASASAVTCNASLNNCSVCDTDASKCS